MTQLALNETRSLFSHDLSDGIIIISEASKILLKEKLLNTLRNWIASGSSSLCNLINKPYVLLIGGETLIFIYIQTTNSYNNVTPLLKPILDSSTTGDFLKYLSHLGLEGISYGAGRTSFELIKREADLKQIVGNAAIIMTWLDLTCSSLFNFGLPVFPKYVIKGIAAGRIIDFVTNKENRKNIKEKILINLKKPTIICTLILATTTAGLILYNVFANHDMHFTVPDVATIVEQGVLSTYAFRIGKSIIENSSSFYNKIKNKKFALFA